jgi:hypothetical protein
MEHVYVKIWHINTADPFLSLFPSNYSIIHFLQTYTLGNVNMEQGAEFSQAIK